MREIKFRGKRINIDEWVYGFYFQRKSEDGRDKCHFIHDGNCIQYMVKPETIGQYTGLKDKDGKEIYEGDILKWFEENGRFQYKGIAENKPGWFLIKDELACRRILVRLMEAYNIEVIGNKYENPELLEADTND